jgi:hypothetical protein
MNPAAPTSVDAIAMRNVTIRIPVEHTDRIAAELGLLKVEAR